MTEPPNPNPSQTFWLTMAGAIGRMEGKVDQLLAAQLMVKENVDDHEIRIRSLERQQWKRTGAAATAGAFVGILTGWLAKIGIITG